MTEAHDVSSNQAQYAFFGAAPDTTNRGVSALFRCVAEGVGRALPHSRLLVFDNGIGFREARLTLSSGETYGYRRVGARGGKRYYASENLATMAALSLVGRWGARVHPILAALDRCSAVLDVSGGDSFSDIYGAQRFWNIVRPKLIAARRGVPLVLLPQTYGPFHDAERRRVAKRAVQGARLAWARDPNSFRALQTLLGDDFDPKRHREGVDVAFNLEPSDPGEKLGPEVRAWLDERQRRPLVGINVSGLVALDPQEARGRFNLKADYPGALATFMQSMMASSDARILLIPHVMSPPGSPESDVQACRQMLNRLAAEFQPRVQVTPTDLDEREVKWLISKLDWFCGMRMHSTIAALSSRVPTVAVAYSDKTSGVFETCHVGDWVIDPRRLETPEVVARLTACWEGRAEAAAILAKSVVEVKARAAQQFAEIVDTLKEGSIDLKVSERAYA